LHVRDIDKAKDGLLWAHHYGELRLC
jgi:hypothetical protein